MHTSNFFLFPMACL